MLLLRLWLLWLYWLFNLFQCPRFVGVFVFVCVVASWLWLFSSYDVGPFDPHVYDRYWFSVLGVAAESVVADFFYLFLCVPLCSSLFLFVPLCCSLFLFVPFCSILFQCMDPLQVSFGFGSMIFHIQICSTPIPIRITLSFSRSHFYWRWLCRTFLWRLSLMPFQWSTLNPNKNIGNMICRG